MAEAKGGRSLVLDGITHRYPGGALAVENINLDIKGGEIIALLGPSGCGKTTLLRIIAGFIAQSQGRIIIGDDIVDALPPNRRAEIGRASCRERDEIPGVVVAKRQ